MSADEDWGWLLALNMPFNSPRLAGATPQGSQWRLALARHTRGEAGGTPIADLI